MGEKEQKDQVKVLYHGTTQETAQRILQEGLKRLQGLQKKMEEIGEERSKYRRGSLYETFLAGVEQGIFYALNYPYASISMGETLAESREKDRKKEK